MSTRFEFGKNWQAFLSTLDESRIVEAEKSLRKMLQVEDLEGKRFLDVGSGSGLFSLAAKRLGAQVFSFDYDQDSVNCTQELKRKYFPDDDTWKVEQGSVLDANYMSSLGKFDVVYSWGVLHHTGDMELAFSNVLLPITDGSQLFIAIYNDEGTMSRIWTKIKKIYCSGLLGRFFVLGTLIPLFFLKSVVLGMIRNGAPWGYFRSYKKRRGMSAYYNWIDWFGGYPFEVAKPEEVFHRFLKEGMELENIVTTNRLGCNEFVFKK